MKKYFFYLLLALPLAFVACNDDDDDGGTEQETITTVQLNFTGPGFNETFTWEDLDGDGGNAPTIDTISLPALNAGITLSVKVLDRSKTPEEDITEEIEEEDDEHLLVFNSSTNELEFVAYLDNDGNMEPLGLMTSWSTDQPANGTFRALLYHEPTNKGDLNNPGGETDFDITFPLVIQ